MQTKIRAYQLCFSCQPAPKPAPVYTFAGNTAAFSGQYPDMSSLRLQRRKGRSLHFNGECLPTVITDRQNGRQRYRTSRPTAKLHFRQLVQEGHLVQHGSGRGTWYSAGR